MPVWNISRSGLLLRKVNRHVVFSFKETIWQIIRKILLAKN
jgi:hypothetical protein